MDIQKSALTKIKQGTNSRMQYSKPELSTLMASIKENGLLQPITVSKTTRGRYEVVAGNRRFLAYKKLAAGGRGFKTIPAVVREKMPEKELMLNNLIENVQRDNLHPVELGRYFDRLVKKFKMTPAEIGVACSVGKLAVQAALDAYNKIPKSWHKKIEPEAGHRGGRRKKGVVPTTIALDVAKTNIGRQDREKIFSWASRTGAPRSQVKKVVNLVAAGTTATTATRIFAKAEQLTFKINVPADKVKTAGSRARIRKRVMSVLRKHLGVEILG